MKEWNLVQRDIGAVAPVSHKHSFSSFIKGIADAGVSGLTSGVTELAGSVGKVLTLPIDAYNRSQNNKYQERQQRLASDLDQRNWRERFDLENAYNTPEAQVKRALEAGINPYVQSDMVESLGAANPSSSSPGGQFSPPNSLFASPSGFREMANATLAKKQGERYDELTDSQIKENLSKADNQEADTVLKEIDAQYAHEFKQAGLQKAWLGVKNLFADTLVKGSQITANDAAAFKSKMDGFYSQAAKNLKEEELAQMKIRTQRLDEIITSEVKRNLQEAFKAGQQGKLAGEQAKTEQQLRPYKTAASAIDNGLKAIEFDVQKGTSKERMQLVHEQLTKLGLANGKLAVEFEKAKKENKVHQWRQYLEMAKLAVEIGETTARGYSEVKNSDSHSRIADAAEENAETNSSRLSGLSAKELLQLVELMQYLK